MEMREQAINCIENYATLRGIAPSTSSYQLLNDGKKHGLLLDGAGVTDKAIRKLRAYCKKQSLDFDELKLEASEFALLIKNTEGASE